MSQSHYHVYLPPVLSSFKPPIPRLAIHELNVGRDVDSQFDFGHSSQVSRIKRATSQSQGSTQLSEVRQVLGDVTIPDPLPGPGPSHTPDRNTATKGGSRRESKRKSTTFPDLDLDEKLEMGINMDVDTSKRGMRIKRSRAPLTLSGTTVDDGDSLGNAPLTEDGIGLGSGSRRRSARISRGGSHPGMSISLSLDLN
jgi:hypothetical protein